MRPCKYCGRHFNNKRGLNIHIALMHKNHNNQESFNSTHHNNGNGYETIKEDIEDLKGVVEEIKWALRGYINVKKRKKISEEDSIKDKVGYMDVLNELKARFNLESVGSNTSDDITSIKPPRGAHTERMETENSEIKKEVNE